MLKEPAGMHKALKAVAALTGVGVGVTTGLALASAKQIGPAFPQGGAPLSTQVYVTVARAIGPQLAQKIFSGVPNIGFVSTGAGQYVGGLANTPQGFNPFGPINTATFSGIGLLLLDWGVKSFIGSKYGYKYFSPFVKAIGAGLIAGGVIGGILDDPGPARGGSLGGARGTSAYASVAGLSGAAVASNVAASGRGGGLP